MNPGFGLSTLRSWWQKLVAPLDGPLMTITALLVLLAFGVMTSASPERINPQLLNMAVALAVMRVVAQVPPQRLMHLAVPIYLLGILLLIAVALFGDVSKGARRWLNLGFMRIQPSELMKIAMPLLLAWFFQKREAMPRMRDYAIAAIMLLLPVGLIARQPDLGTAILVLAAGFYVIFFAGLSWKIMIGMAVAAIAAAPLAWNLLHDYQRNRIITLFDPKRTRWARASTSSSPPSPSVPAASSERAGVPAPRPNSSSFPNGIPTSSSPCSRRNSACSATLSCWCSMPC